LKIRRIYDIQGFRASGLQGFRASGLQGFRASGQNCAFSTACKSYSSIAFYKPLSDVFRRAAFCFFNPSPCPLPGTERGGLKTGGFSPLSSQERGRG